MGYARVFVFVCVVGVCVCVCVCVCVYVCSSMWGGGRFYFMIRYVYADMRIDVHKERFVLQYFHTFFP